MYMNRVWQAIQWIAGILVLMIGANAGFLHDGPGGPSPSDRDFLVVMVLVAIFFIALYMRVIQKEDDLPWD